MQLQKRVANQNVLIFGLGLQGGGVKAANTLIEAGANVRATDNKSAQELEKSLAQLDSRISGVYGSHNEEDILWADIIIKNPAVPYEHRLLQQALQLGKVVTTETALAIEIIRDRTIGITGTRGKTTTTTLIYTLLKEAGKPVVLCGNIPEQPTLAALRDAHDDTWFVVEISSFHIEGMIATKTSPHIAVVTNVFPDHLNRYENLEAYAKVKASLFAYQKPGDKAFWGTQHDWTELFESQIQPGVEQHPVSPSLVEAARAFGSPLPGEHNLQNVALAAEVAKVAAVSPAQIKTCIQNFTGVPYRLEPVATRNGITYINDTTSTTPIALQKALEAQVEPFVLICGGTTKHLPFSTELLEKMNTIPHAIVFLQGSGTTELFEQLAPVSVPHSFASSLDQAVEQAEAFCHDSASSRIVFSPGFSSFELFKNEFDRGDQFTQLARRAV